MPSIKIEQVPYKQQFTLPGDDEVIYKLVDYGEAGVSRKKPLKVKSQFGQVVELEWGTIVHPVR